MPATEKLRRLGSGMFQRLHCRSIIIQELLFSSLDHIYSEFQCAEY